jgi:predicted dehydrogenase
MELPVPNPLRVLVVGAGWAGEGHTKALQWCGVEVAALCARQPEVVQEVAARLGVPEAVTVWRAALERKRPDIVTLATPAPLRRTVEGEEGFSAILEFPGPAGALPVTVTLGQGLALPGEVDGWRLYGRTGTLLARREGGRFSYTVSRFGRGDHDGEPLPVPERLQAALPPVGDDEQQKWCALAQDFIADIRGEPHHPYLTFRDGWRALVAIGAIRAGRGPTSLPTWRLERHRQVLHAVDDGAGHRLQRCIVGAA